MQIRIKGEHSIADIKQVLIEMLTKAECDYGVQYTIDATLYIRPTNGSGKEFTPSYPNGRPIQYLYSNGPYQSAADDYDCN